MSNRSEFPKILEYIDHFHQDVRQLAVLIDRLFDSEGYEYLPSATNSVGDVSSHFEKPIRWRMRHIYRYYIPIGIEQPDSSILFIIYLGRTSPFNFPPMLCARLSHEPLKESQIHRSIYRKSNLRPLIRGNSKWINFREEKGWSFAEPNFDSPVNQIKGYILNLFDIKTRNLVIDNVITPLTSDNSEFDLNLISDLTKFTFPETQSPINT